MRSFGIILVLLSSSLLPWACRTAAPLPDEPIEVHAKAVKNLSCATPQEQGENNQQIVTGLSIPEIQGRGHCSPFLGFRVESLHGIVTAVSPPSRNPGFWIQTQQPDGDDATSDALFVLTDKASSVRPGDLVSIAGTVEEHGWPGELTTTRVRSQEVGLLGSGECLPDPVLLSKEGRLPPRHFPIVSGSQIAPETHPLDFFESLEGMRVEIPGARVVGPTSNYGGCALLSADSVRDSRAKAQGVLVHIDEDTHPDRLLVDASHLPFPLEVASGDSFEEPVQGVLRYAYGAYRVFLTNNPKPRQNTHTVREVTTLRSDSQSLTLASFNLENFSLVSPEDKLSRIATVITQNLLSPDILGLQEIQDDSGWEDNGVVSARGTLQRLVESIVSHGGPRYHFRQIDPVDGSSGGKTGSNIRVAVLFNPARVEAVDRTAIEAGDRARILMGQEGPELHPSPARVAPDNPAFSGSEDKAYKPSRKPLAVEFRVPGLTRPLMVIVVHLSSKSGDDPLFGAHQPPRARTEGQRRHQVQAVASLIQEILSLDPQASVAVLGDFNDMPWKEPMAPLTRELLVDLTGDLEPGDTYSHIYLGLGALLDNILLSPGLVQSTSPILDVVHASAAFPATDHASDHDPVVVRLSLPREPSR